MVKRLEKSNFEANRVMAVSDKQEIEFYDDFVLIGIKYVKGRELSALVGWKSRPEFKNMIIDGLKILLNEVRIML